MESVPARCECTILNGVLLKEINVEKPKGFFEKEKGENMGA